MRAIRRWLPAALSLLLGAQRASADPLSPADARVALEHQRARYADALDRANWQRDDPAVRAVADQVTGEALEILRDVPALEGEVRALVHDAAGAPLGPWLHEHASVGEPLLGAWLRGHDDNVLVLALVPHDPQSRLALAGEVVFQRPALAAELISEGIRTSSARLGDFCAVANALPAARRRELAMMAWQATRFELFGECLALVASHPTLRNDLAQRALAELGRDEQRPPSGLPAGFHMPGADTVAWPVVAAVLTIPAVAPALAERLLAASIHRRDDLWVSDAIEALSRAAPWIRADHRAVAAVLADVERRERWALLRMLPVPSHARLSDRVAGCVSWSELPGDMHRVTDDLVREIALATPRDVATGERVVRALGELRLRFSAYAARVTPTVIDAWTDAIRRTSRCTDDGCLRSLVRSATDETAARAAWLLGPRGLASLPADDARALVQRLVLDRPISSTHGAPVRLVEPSALATVVYGSLPTCPASLRGIAPIDLFESSNAGDPLAPWRRAFAARCRDEAPSVGAP